MENKSQFAGFWKRFLAYVIDLIIASIGVVVVNFLVGLGIGIVFGIMHMDAASIKGIFYWLGLLVSFVVYSLYWIIFESSRLQATPGKMALGLVVTDVGGGRITFWRAAARNAAKLISGLFFAIGFIICSFTQRKQAAHDLLARTLVVSKNAPLRVGAGQTFS